MIADDATRRNLSLYLIKPDSVWFTGYQWMTEPSKDFPMFSAKEISLTQSSIQAMNRELSREAIKSTVNLINKIPTQVRDRYEFSPYTNFFSHHSNRCNRYILPTKSVTVIGKAT